MSLKNLLPSNQSPLYILGSGSIGLLYASLMQIQMRLLSKRYSQKVRLSPCLLLRSHHKAKVISTYSQEYRERLFPIHINSLQQNIHVLKELSNQPKDFKDKHEGFSTGSDDDDIGDGTVASIDNYIGHKFIISAFKDVNGDTTLLDIPAKIIDESNLKSNSSANGFIKNILLCTKAPDAVNAIESILHLMHPTERAKIIVMTNGSMAVVSDLKSMLDTYENDDDLSDRVDIIFASTTHGAHRGGDFAKINRITHNQSFNVHHAGVGHTYLESTNDNDAKDDNELCTVLSDIWNQAGLRCNLISSTEMNILNWKKLATNCAINPLTALRQCKNGDLLHDIQKSKLISKSKQRDIPVNEIRQQHIKAASDSSTSRGSNNIWKHTDPMIFYQLIREVSDVAIAEASISTHVNDKRIKESLEFNALVQFVEGVVRDTANNNSSMFQDVIHKRYPTEIKYLNGYIANLGRDKLGVDVIANENVCAEVEQLTKLFKYK